MTLNSAIKIFFKPFHTLIAESGRYTICKVAAFSFFLFCSTSAPATSDLGQLRTVITRQGEIDFHVFLLMFLKILDHSSAVPDLNKLQKITHLTFNYHPGLSYHAMTKVMSARGKNSQSPLSHAYPTLATSSSNQDLLSEDETLKILTLLHLHLSVKDEMGGYQKGSI